MWKLLKYIGYLLRLVFWCAALLALGMIALLYVFEHGIPQIIVNRLEEKISDKEVMVEIGRATFTMGNGLHLYNISAEPRKLAGESFGRIEEAAIELSISPLITHNERIHSVTLRGVEMPNHPRRIFRELAKLKEKREPRKPRKELPALKPFKLTVEDSCVIGLSVSKTTATVVLTEPEMRFNDIRLTWQGAGPPRQITGTLMVDLDRDIITGSTHGQAFQEDIEPFLKEMGARGALHIMQRITGVEKAATASCDFNANIENGNFVIALDLDVGQCKYRDVALDYARLDITACETNGVVTVDIKNLSSANASGKLDGDIFYNESDESVKVRGASTMNHNEVLTMIDILTHGELDPIEPIAPPVVTIEGIAAVATNSTVRHNLQGTVRIGEGVVFGLNIQEAAANFRVQRDSAFLDNVKGSTPSRGKVSGQAEFEIPDNSDLPPAIIADVKFDEIDLSDLAKVFSITNDRAGACFGDMHLSGILGTNQLHTLNGNGKFAINKGLLTRLPLFAGFTDYISRNIPGVDRVVDQSDCSLDFIIKDGILTSNNFTIEGDVFSIQGKGSYDITRDNLDFTVHVALFRQKTFAGRVIRMVTFPFKKLLLEFKVYGSINNPEWSYVNILERITDQIPERNK